MRRPTRKRKCLHCKEYFFPDPRNQWHQRYCFRPECRRASKAASQARWLEKPQNRDYFRSPVHVLRVQLWRREHPGYRRRKAPPGRDALQDSINVKTQQKQIDKALKENSPAALQDFIAIQPAVFIGLISHLSGSALQDDIAGTLRSMQKLGMDILNQNMLEKGACHDQKASPRGG